MSLAETQAIFEQLQRIDEILSRIENSSASIEHRLPEVTAMVITTQQALRLFWRASSFMTKMGLPPDWRQAVEALTKIAHAATYAYYAMHLLMLGTPYGYVAGIIGLTTSMISAGQIFEGY
jgi:hypothetical protein